jgi:sugar phosphate isomerase/epimerase
MRVFVEQQGERRMKLSCLPVSYYADFLAGRKTLGGWAAEALGLGLDAIDLSIILLVRRDAAFLDAVRKDIERCGITVNMVATYPDFTHPDATQRRWQLRQNQVDIENAAAIGARYVRVTAGQAHPETGKKEGLEWAIEGIGKSLEHAKRQGITLVYENHSKPGVWQYADFSLPTEIFLEIFRRTEGIDLGINFDTANPLIFGDDPLPILQKVLHRVRTIHASENETIGSMKPTVVGKGIVPFDSIFRVLKASGFTGWVSIEEASGTGRQGIKDAVDFVRTAWERA